jgi:O-antigen ligase
MVAVIALAVGITYVLVTTVDPIHDRIYTGDIQAIGGISLNVTGRGEFWSTTWDSYQTAPYFGHGAGSAAELITSVYSAAIGHPHNDYLRLLHDYGLIGAVLWVAGYLGLMVRTWRLWQGRRRSAQSIVPSRIADEVRIHAAAFLALMGVAIAMITDNPIDYLFVMAPLGLLVGLSLGLGSSTRHASRRSRSSAATALAVDQAAKAPT